MHKILLSLTLILTAGCGHFSKNSGAPGRGPSSLMPKLAANHVFSCERALDLQTERYDRHDIDSYDQLVFNIYEDNAAAGIYRIDETIYNGNLTGDYELQGSFRMKGAMTNDNSLSFFGENGVVRNKIELKIQFGESVAHINEIIGKKYNDKKSPAIGVGKASGIFTSKNVNYSQDMKCVRIP